MTRAVRTILALLLLAAALPGCRKEADPVRATLDALAAAADDRDAAHYVDDQQDDLFDGHGTSSQSGISVLANTSQVSSDFETRLRKMYAFSPNR